MYRTLGALTVAMTSTAALLAYIDSSVTLPPRPLSGEELERIARTVVAESVLVEPGRWRYVEIIPAQDTAADGIALTATANTGDAHFFIDALGRPRRGWQWTRQAATTTDPHTIRIQVTTPDGEDSPSSTQLDGARALLSAIAQVTGGQIAVLSVP